MGDGGIGRSRRDTYLRGWDICLSIERNETESVLIEEGDKPLQQSNKALQDAEEDRADEVSFLAGVRAGNGASLSQQLYKRDEQTSEGDGTKGVSGSALECSTSNTLWHSFSGVGVEVPRSIDTRDSDVDNILKHLRDPVPSEGNEDD